jgi:hypothetical protein
MRLVLSAQRVSTLLLCKLVCALLATGCAGSSAGPSGGAGASVGNTEPGEAGAADTTNDPVPESLAFMTTKTVMLSPKQTQVLTVTTDPPVTTAPPGNFHVQFALVGSSSNSGPGDAVLSAGDVPTVDGIAQVTLTAPSTPTTFSVRASVAGSVSTLLAVSVSALGYTTLRVQPAYNGHRSVTQWTASARVGSKCSKLVGDPPPDDPLTVTAKLGQPLEIEHVKIGVDVAVTLRAGHYIDGCADQGPLSEGDGNQVLVYASDRPINLDATRLALSFGPSNAAPEFAKLMKNSVSVAESALVGASGGDVQALLDAMQSATVAADRDAFSTTRLAKGWDAALTSAFGHDAPTRLRDPADRWMSAGLQSFEAPGSFSGQLTSLSAGALLELTSVAGVPASEAGFPTSFQSTWSADSSDTLLLGTQLTWLPSRLVTALALGPALLEFPQAESLESALAQSVDCGLVAQTLLADGATAGAAVYAGCDASCAVLACSNALSSLWSKARDSSGTTVATLDVTGTGSAAVGDDAAATALNKGSWVGQLSVGQDSAPVSGTLSATSASN